MQVYLLKDVTKIGMAGEILKVTDGYAQNFLLPRKLAVELTAANEAFYKNKIKKIEHRKEVIATETSLLAEKIKETSLLLKRKTHDKEKLYNSINAAEVVEALAAKGISISKSQVDFDKSIKNVGSYAVTIKLSSRLKPQLTLKVVAE